MTRIEKLWRKKRPLPYSMSNWPNSTTGHAGRSTKLGTLLPIAISSSGGVGCDRNLANRPLQCWMTDERLVMLAGIDFPGSTSLTLVLPPAVRVFPKSAVGTNNGILDGVQHAHPALGGRVCTRFDTVLTRSVILKGLRRHGRSAYSLGKLPVL